MPKRKEEEWIRSLSSTHPAEQLATLVWLSDEHPPSDERRLENVNQESVEAAKLFEAVRDASRTRNALHELARSNNLWVREYATFTSSPERPSKVLP